MSATLAGRKEELDVSKIFLSYLAACGDVVRCSQVAKCTIADVLFLERSECWAAKLSEVSIVPGQSKDDAAEATREINRAACHVQALRLKALIDQTLKWIYDEPGRVCQFAQEIDKKGNSHFSTKPVLELVKAAESAHAMLYRSLGDKPLGGQPLAGERSKVTDVHLSVVQLMQSIPGMLPISDLVTPSDIRPRSAPANGYLEFDVSAAMSDPKNPPNDS